MNCKNCGAPLVMGDQFCKNCGTPVVNNNVPNQNSGIEMPNYANTNPMSTSNVSNANNGMPNTTDIMPNTNNAMPSYSAINSVSTQFEPKKNNNIIFIIITIVLVIIIGVLGFLLINKDSGTTQVTNNNGSSGSVTPVSKTSTYKVTAFGHSFEVPTDVVYEKSEQSITFAKENAGWIAQVEANAGDFRNVILYKDQLKTNLINMGFTVPGNPEEKTISGKTYIVIEAEVDYYNVSFVATELSSGYVAAIMIMDVVENKKGSLYLEDVDAIIKTAKYVGETSNMEMNKLPESWASAINDLK